MEWTDETLMAYADGELDETTRAGIAAAIAKDAGLAARVAQHQALRVDVFAAFAGIADEAVPERLARTLATAPAPATAAAATSAVAQLDAARAQRTSRLSNAQQRIARWSWPEWGALAASLVVGVLAGAVDWRGAPATAGSGGMLATVDGQIAAQGKLAQALTQHLASAQAQDDPVKIGVSFLSKDGHYCRSFTAADTDSSQAAHLAGLACKAGEKEAWNIAVVTQQGAPASGAGNSYRTAAAEMPAAVLQAIDESISGQTLDAQAEQAAKEHGWRR